MKIGLYMDADYTKAGGVQEYVKGLYDYLKTKKHQPLIITPSKSNRIIFDEKRKVVNLGKSIDFTTLRSSASLALAWSEKHKLESFLNNEKFDILHLMSPFGVLGFQLLEISKAKNVATFHITNTANLIKFSIKTVFPLVKKRMEKLEARLAISPVAHDFAKKYFSGRYTIIPPGVDTKRFNPNKKRIKKYRDGKVNILFIGRLDERKGIKYLLKAYGQIKPFYLNSRLIIGGTGPKEKEAKKYIKEKKLKDVVFSGFISQKEIPKYYSSSDIFCSPATKDETFGVVLIEAFASGLPVVAFDNSGYRTVLKGQNRGFLVKNKSADALGQALLILMTNRYLREDIGKRNLDLVKNEYTWEVVGNKIIEFYKSL